MDLAALNLALQARAESDTGTGGLFALSPLVTGWYPNRAKAGQRMPYVVTNIADWHADNAFQKDVSEVMVRFSVFHSKEDAVDTNTLATCSSIIKRIYGNWSSASPSTAPTYGFHRHTLTIASGSWTATAMQLTGVREEHEERYWHFVIEGRFQMSQ